ncbi:MAG TPA: FlgD immunoglobulin-like domain containing protein, partial [Candidatus Polarisedimenticolia bacterium]|nr:FlgD immunoglobulin-like domain containing protein [Candidatus Polarisedimenticolia bacterium]
RFPIMAVDQGDNIHIVFSDRHNIYLISCPAGANPTVASSWTKPVPLNAPRVAGFEFTRTCVFPWIHGGAAGKVAVIWYGTEVDGEPDTPQFEADQVPWKMVYAQVEDALSAQPTVYLDIASKQGGGVVHKGQICLRGLGCPDGTRELAEYSSLTVDNSGFPNIIYEATIIDGADPSETSAICFFTKGTQRPLTTSETLTEISCGDGSVSSYGGWHSVADDRATDGEYCRNVGANKTNSKAYLQFSFTGNQVDLQIGRGSRGGNAEVLIDGISRGKVDFYRAPADPTKPDNSGKKDLTFGEFASFPVTQGAHTLRLNVLNDAGTSSRDMIYVDGFVVHSGGATGSANPTETAVTVNGTAPAGILKTPGLAVEHVTTTPGAQLIEAIFEVPEGEHPRFKILDTFGSTLQTLDALLPTGSLRAAPALPGAYAVAVVNGSGTPIPYTLRIVTTNGTGTGGMVAAQPGANGAQISPAAAVADPIDDQAVMRYVVDRAGPVTMRVYDVTGRMVHEAKQEQPVGVYAVHWNGRLADGRRVPSGIYFYRVTTPDGKETVHKTAILR